MESQRGETTRGGGGGQGAGIEGEGRGWDCRQANYLILAATARFSERAHGGGEEKKSRENLRTDEINWNRVSYFFL
jgi:hypothetical protein